MSQFARYYIYMRDVVPGVGVNEITFGREREIPGGIPRRSRICDHLTDGGSDLVSGPQIGERIGADE